MKSKPIILAIALALASVAASAGTLQEGEITKGQKTLTKAGAFKDVYVYSFDFAGQPAEVGFSLIELKFKNLTNIDFGTVAFYQDYNFGTMTGITPIGASPYALSPVSISGADGFAIDTLLVPKSPFYLEVAGTAVGTGPNKGSYSFEIEAAPVPEPSSLALVLGGVGVMGFLSSRRRRSEQELGLAA